MNKDIFSSPELVVITVIFLTKIYSCLLELYNLSCGLVAKNDLPLEPLIFN